MKLLLASGNPHKAEELCELFDPAVITVGPAPKKLEVEETGTSYSENALLKAKAYYDEFKVPVIADDSGLNVEALPDELGIYSARFGGEEITYQDRFELLQDKLEGKERDAYFSCTLCIYISPEEVFFFEGRVEGAIGTETQGEHGFGYDPIFYPKKLNGESLAEVPEWKAKNSHRAVACQLAEKFFKAV